MRIDDGEADFGIAGALVHHIGRVIRNQLDSQLPQVDVGGLDVLLGIVMGPGGNVRDDGGLARFAGEAGTPGAPFLKIRLMRYLIFRSWATFARNIPYPKPPE